jgi:general nucleoside transport system ATP-binding protein
LTSPAPAPAPALELRGIEKRFGPVRAVTSLDLAIRCGEVHAVLGENGAGKSTLMNISSGFLAPDVGLILVNGEPVEFGSPRDALAAGVGMVHQHFRLVAQFSVAENLAIGANDVPAVISRGELNERAAKLSEQFRLSVEPDRPVWTLSAGEKQRVEILRTLCRGAQVLILDEPTAVLTPDEGLQLCATLRDMAADGVAVVFISHKLNEVLDVADRISVMRRGSLVATEPRHNCDVDSLARLMFGDVSSTNRPTRRERTSEGPVVLKVTRVSATDERGVKTLKDISFDVRRGEIVGVVGVAGNGQQDLEAVVTGLVKPDSGDVQVDDGRNSGPRAAKHTRVAHIPEDRLGMGLVPGEPIWSNAILRRHREKPISHGPLLRRDRARKFASDLAQSVNLSTTSVRTPVGHLSGGNAQKLLTGRELYGDRVLVVAVNPTQGLDVRAAAGVREALQEAAGRGLGVLLISADLDEVLLLGDRVAVLYEGAIVGQFNRDQTDRDQIGKLMGGDVSGAPNGE